MTRDEDTPPMRGPSHIDRTGPRANPQPIYRIHPRVAAHLSHSISILRLFAVWAQRRGFDPVSIYARANPQQPPLRPDQLLGLHAWPGMPEQIDTQRLIKDLRSIGERRLCSVIRQVERGEYLPEPAYTHWVVTEHGQIAGEARELDPPKFPDEQGQHFCYVRLLAMPDCAEYGYTSASNLRAKHESIGGPKSSPTTG